MPRTIHAKSLTSTAHHWCPTHPAPSARSLLWLIQLCYRAARPSRFFFPVIYLAPVYRVRTLALTQTSSLARLFSCREERTKERENRKRRIKRLWRIPADVWLLFLRNAATVLFRWISAALHSEACKDCIPATAAAGRCCLQHGAGVWKANGSITRFAIKRWLESFWSILGH